jgi:tol-pal system protein YbgF
MPRDRRQPRQPRQTLAVNSSPSLRRTSRLVLACGWALAAGACVTSTDIEGLRSQLSDVERQVLQVQKQSSSKQEVESLEASVGKQMDSLLKTEADMQVKLQDLSGQIEALQAKLEDTNYRLGQLSSQIAATNQDLKSFRGTAVPPSPVTPGPPGPGQPAPGADSGAPSPGFGVPGERAGGSDPQGAYNAAYNDYLKGNYDLALRGFQQYLESFPTTSLAANATYWIGESYYRQKRYRQAIEQYDAVLNRYPRSDKTASALLKKGYAHLELGERSQGVVQLQHVLRQFPTSDEANLARQRLREIGIDGR